MPEVAAPRKRVLIVAYAISPVLGSEYRSAWELVQIFSQKHEVTLLFGDSDGLMGSFAHFDKYAEDKALPYRAIKIEPSERQQRMARRMLRMPLGLFFPMLLRQWHKQAYAVAKELHAEQPFDVVHQLGPIGFRNPGYCWQLDCHSYWGPIGGAQYIDTRMILNKSSSYYLEALFRNLSVRLQKFSPYIARAAKRFDRLSFATVENEAWFAENFGRHGPVISDQGVDLTELPPLSRKSEGRALRVAWAGSLIPRKNVAAMLDIVAAAPEDVIFDLVGDGPLAADVQAAAARHPNLHFHGRLPRAQVISLLQAADVILLTSLSEANTAILFEGLENGCIPVAPRINGFVSTINDKVGYLIDQGDHDKAVSQAADAIASLRDPALRVQMRKALDEHLPTLSWAAMAEIHEAQYG